MKKKYTSAEILDMALKKAAADYAADLDGNGIIDVNDARTALRREQGLEKDPLAENEGGTGAFGGFFGSDGAVGGNGGGSDSLMKKELLDSLISDSAAYDFNADRLYNEYKREYEKNAYRAAKNVYGLASSQTGGYGSSYAASSAAAAYDKYMSALSEKLPKYAESVSTIRKNEIQNRLNALSEIRKSEADSYSRFSDGVKNAWTAAENGDYSFLEALGMDTSLMRDERSMKDAVTHAKYGDYSELKKLGVDTSAAEYAELLDIASGEAKHGDYSLLEMLGVNVDSLRKKERLETALALAKYGDYSLLGDFSSNFTPMKEKIGITVQKGVTLAYAAGGYKNLVNYLNRQINFGQITERGKQQIIKALTGN